MENPFSPLPMDPGTPPDQPVWLEGGRLWTHDGAVWPCRCAVCGEPTWPERPLVLHLQWHPRWMYLLFLLSIWIYLIVAVFMRRRLRVTVFLCERHLAARRNGHALLALALLGGPALIGLGGNLDQFLLVLLGILLLVGGLMGGALLSRSVRALRIEGGRAWVTAGDGFLRSVDA